MVDCNGIAANREARLKQVAARWMRIVHIDAPEPVEQWTKIDRRLVGKLDLETTVMNQQRLQLIHIGQVVPCSSCTSTVASTISSREIRLSCPHKGPGVALSTGNTTALRQDCIENHLSNKGLPYPKGSIATVTSIWNPPNVNIQKTDKTWFWSARTLHPILHDDVEEGIDRLRRVRPTLMCPDV